MNVSGFARFSQDQVIKACEGTLQSIQTTRHDEQRAFLDNTLARKIWWWKYLWVWITFGLAPKPTKRDALYEYIYVGWVPAKIQIEMLTRQEEICKKVLAAVKNSADTHISLTPESAAICNVGRKV